MVPTYKNAEHPRVFLDTNVLLKAFPAYRTGNQLPEYMGSSVGSRFTFEKCIFETYMAFRGVGGKKPDEGRGRWAQSHLKQPNDPSSLSTLANKFHSGNGSWASFWINHILGAGCDLDSLEESARYYVRREDLKKALQEIDNLRALSQQRILYEALCDEFRQMLYACEIVVLPYRSVFGQFRGELESGGSDKGPEFLDRVVRDTVIPSEDFEIVYATLRLAADIFVTDDSRLRNCAMSLGENFALVPTAFCSTAEYTSRIEAFLKYKL